MRQLQRELGRLFGAGRAPRYRDKDSDNARAKFKRLAVKHGLAWSKSHDGYIEIDATIAWPRGLVFAHHDWPDSLARLEHCLERPEDCAEGSYSE